METSKLVWWLGSLLLLASLEPLRAQLNTPGIFLSRSDSGQFVIQSARAVSASPFVSYLENDTNFIRLDPILLPVSCERIKQLVWKELNATAPWRGKIFLRLYPASSAEDPITLDSEQFRDGWQYRLSIPAVCHRERYVRAVVSVLLLELANRGANGHSAELPVWLTEGLSREIWVSSEREVILPPPQVSTTRFRMTTMQVNTRQYNPLEQAHQELCAATPLTFQQLSWPSTNPQEKEELYRSSAQVFVHQLLQLPNGPACLRSMLEELPQFYNWQFAFLHAFHDTFQRPLEVEKWWSLQLVHFTGRELGDSWGPEESWQKLDELVRSSVQVRIGTNELPLHAEIALQTVIREWPAERQAPALGNKLHELQMLRPRLARELAQLVDDYCRVIETYIETLNRHGFILPFRKHAVLRHSSEETLQRLDALDARRLSLRPATKPEEMQANSRAISTP